MIVKTFIGKHIDLDRIVAISDAFYSDNHTGYGYPMVGVTLDIQLLDHPLCWERSFAEDEFRQHIPARKEHTYSSGVKSPAVKEQLQAYAYVDSNDQIYWEEQVYPLQSEKKNLLALVRVQRQVDDLINQWRARKTATDLMWSNR